MKIATYNINGINGRLDILLHWLDEAAPDIVCLQELKGPDEKFPLKALERVGYGAKWRGQKSWNGVAILARGTDPIETKRTLPGGRDDGQSRYIEAAVHGVIIGCLYLPNGNPAPGQKFDDKLRWFERLRTYAQELLELEIPVALVGDSTSCLLISITSPTDGAKTRCFALKCETPIELFWIRDGRTL